MPYDAAYAPVSDAPWPVINARPSFGAILKNLKFTEYTTFIGTTLVGATFGFVAGLRARQGPAVTARTHAPRPTFRR